MNVSSRWGLWLIFPFVLSCTEAIPEGSFIGSLFSKPAILGDISELRVADTSPRTVSLPGTCDALSSEIEVSLDEALWFPALGSDLDCSDGTFNINLEINNAGSPDVYFSGTPDPETVTFSIRTQTLLGATEPFQLSVIYDSTYTGPLVNLSNLPSVLTNQAGFSSVVDSSHALHYQYALQTSATACSVASFGTDQMIWDQLAASAGEGDNRLCVRGKDLAGVYGANIVQYDWTLDTVPPSVLSLAGGVPGTYTIDPNLNVTLTSPDAVDVRYKVIPSTGDCASASGYGVATPLVSGLVTTLGSDNTYKICVVGGDAAGNWMAWGDAEESSEFTLDRSQPTVTLSSSVSSPTPGGFVVNVVFSEPVTGLVETDFTGTASASLTLSGSGAVYTLTVNPAVNYENFNITLPAAVVADSAGNGNMASAQTISTQYIQPEVQFLAATANGNEDVGTHEVVVSLSSPSASDVVFTVTRSGTATLTDDYTDTGLSYTIPSGQTLSTVTVTVINDSLGEPDETLTYEIDSVSGGGVTVGAQGTHTFTINENDTPTLQFATAGASVTEDVGTSNLVFALSNESSQDVSFTLADLGTGTATPTADYTLVGGTLTIPAGSLNHTVSVVIVNDGVFEPTSETLELQINAPINATLGAQSAYTLTINEILPHGPASQIVFTTQPTLTSAGADINLVATIQDAFGNTVTTGGDSVQTVTITRSGGPVATLNGTSSKAAVAGVATFGAAESLDFTVAGMNYTLDASITSPAVSTTSTTFAIVHGPASQIVFTTQPLNPTNVGENILLDLEIQDAFGNIVTTGGNSTATITLNLSVGTGLTGVLSKGATLGEVSFVASDNVQISDPGTGYVLRASGASLTADSSPFDVSAVMAPFTWTNSALDNDWFNAANWSGGVVPGASDVATFTDACGANCEANAVGPVTIAGLDVQSTYSNANIISLSGNTLIGSSGISIQGGYVSVAGSSLNVDGNINVSAGGYLELVGSILTAQQNVMVANPSNFISVSAAELRLAGSAPATLGLNGAAIYNLSFQKLGLISISGSVNVQGNLNLHCNGSESFNGGQIYLQGNMGFSGTGGSCFSRTTAIFVNGSGNQFVNSPSVTSYHLPNVYVQKPSGTVTFQGPINIRRNFSAIFGDVVFDPGSEIRLVGDGSDNSTVEGFASSMGSLTIDKAGGSVLLNSNTFVDGSFFFYNGTLNGISTFAVGGDVSIGSGASGSTARLEMFGPGTELSSSVNLPFSALSFLPGPGQSISLGSPISMSSAPAQANLIDGILYQNGHDFQTTGTLTVNVGSTWVQDCANLSYGVLSGSGDVMSGSNVTLSIADATAMTEPVSSAQAQDFIVSLTGPNCQDTTFEYFTTDGTAVSPSDYQAVAPTAVTIPTGNTTATVSVMVESDNLYESNEYYTLSLQNFTGGVGLGDVTALGTILDDDSMPVINIANFSGLEGGVVQPVVTLSVPSGADVVFDYATSDGTATQPGDYASASGTVTLAAGQTIVTLAPISLVDDSPHLDPGEHFVLQLSNITGATAGTVTGQITINESAPLVIYRSVGYNMTSPLAVGGGNGLTLSGGVANFTMGLAPNIGVGDALQYDENNDGVVDGLIFIQERLSANSFVVRRPDGSTPGDMPISDNDWSIFRAYTSLANAAQGNENTGIAVGLRNFDAWTNGRDLITHNENWKIAIYADGFDESMASFGTDWITGPSHRLVIFAPHRSEHVGVRQRHIGEFSLAYAGMRKVAAGSNVMIQTPYVQIEGLQFQDIMGDFGVSHLDILPNVMGHISIEGNIFVKNSTAGPNGLPVNLIDAMALGIVFEVANNQFVGIKSEHCLSIVGGVSRVYHNSFLLCGNQDSHRAVSLQGQANQQAFFKNNVFFEQTQTISGIIADFSAPHLVLENNILWRNPSPWPVGTNLVSDPEFANPDGFDFRILPGEPGVGYALDLGADPDYQFKEDVLGKVRPVGDWDVGPFQVERPSSMMSDLLGLRTEGVAPDRFRVEALMAGNQDFDASATIQFCLAPCDPALEAESSLSSGPPDEFYFDSPGLGFSGTERTYNLRIRHIDPEHGSERIYYRKAVVYPEGTIRLSQFDVNIVAESDSSISVRAWFEGDTLSPASFNFYYCNASSFPGCDPVIMNGGGTVSISKKDVESIDRVIYGLSPSTTYNTRLVVNDVGLATPFEYNQTVTTFNGNYMRLEGLFVYNYVSSGNGSLEVRVPFYDPNTNNTGATLYVCNRSSDSNCHPLNDGVSFGMSNLSTEFYLSLSNLTVYGFNPDDELVFQVFGIDPDGVGKQGLRRYFRLDNNGSLTFHFHGARVLDLNASQFAIDVDFWGDNNGNSDVLLQYCNGTSDPLCNPPSNRTVAMERRDWDFYFFEEFPVGVGPGDTVRARITVTDPDGTVNVPYDFSFVLSPPSPAMDPSNLRLVPLSDTIMDIGWDAPFDPTLTGYKITYWPGNSPPPDCYSGNEIPSSSIAGNNYRLTGLTPSTEYAFRLCSMNNGAPPSPSAGITGIEWTNSSAGPIPPVDPDHLWVSNDVGTSLELHWSPDTALDVPGSQYVVVYRSGVSPPMDCYDGTPYFTTNTHQLISGLSGTAHSFRLCTEFSGVRSVGKTFVHGGGSAGPTINIVQGAGVEGESVVIYAVLNEPTTSLVTFDWSVWNGSADGSDYSSPGVVPGSIAPGNTIASLSVATSPDVAVESSEYFNVDITNISGAASGMTITQGFIVDDDSNDNWSSGVNGSVFATAYDSGSGRRILAGSFTQWDERVNIGLALVSETGSEAHSFVTKSGFSGGQVRAVASQPDGRIIVAGSFTHYQGILVNKIVRLNVDGSLDGGFNINTGVTNTIEAVALQKDGKILLGGSFTTYDSQPRNGIVRLETNGMIDPSFSVGSGFSGGSVLGLLVQEDDRVVVVGGFSQYNITPTNYIARLNSDGTLDSGFGMGSGANGVIYKVVSQSDGKMLIGGNFTDYEGTSINRIARLNPDGSLDFGFSPGSGANAQVSDMAVLDDGRIYVAGFLTSFNGTSRNRIARIYSDGSLDTSFNPGVGASDAVHAVYLMPDSSVLIGGQFSNYNGSSPQKSYFARVQNNGTLDPSYPGNAGPGGPVRVIARHPSGSYVLGGDFQTYGGYSQGHIVALDQFGNRDSFFNSNLGVGANSPIRALHMASNGNLMVGGAFTSFDGVTLNRRGLVALNSSGLVDGIFSSPLTGTVIVEAIAEYNYLGTDYLLVGGNFTSPENRFVRLGLDGSYIPSGFNTNIGVGSGGPVLAIDVDASNNIYLGGSFTTFNGASRNRIVKLSPVGVYDPSFAAGGFNNVVNTIKVDGLGNVLVGGLFSNYEGGGVGSLVRITSLGTLDYNFPLAGFVNALEVDGSGNIFVGGDLTSYGGPAVSGLIRVTSGGSLDQDYGFPTNSEVSALSLIPGSPDRLLFGLELTPPVSLPPDTFVGYGEF